MDRYTRQVLESYLKEINQRYRHESDRLKLLSNYESMQLKVYHHKNGREYYSVLGTGQSRFKYLGTANNETVQKIKEAHFLRHSLMELQRETETVRRALSRSSDVSYKAIERKLGKAYKGSSQALIISNDAARDWKTQMENIKASYPPFRPEELIHTTHDETMVRSKGEALIYNYLLMLGIPFVYELPLKIKGGYNNSLLLPDFTILSEVDLKTVIYIEHQGMMDNQNYRNGFNEKIYKYWINGYLPERDVYFTFDMPNGGFDDTPVKRIIRSRIRPDSLNTE